MIATDRRAESRRAAIQQDRPLLALVTGASSGIGLAIAELLAARGNDLVLVARREELLQAIATRLQSQHPITVSVFAHDLAEPEAAAAIETQLAASGFEADMLVNSAGFTLDGHYLSYSWREHRDNHQLMTIAPTELIYRLLPGMLRRGFGQVLNIGSLAGMIPATPFNALYGPSKHHMVVLTRTLQLEYGKAGVQFSVCCPGLVRDTAISRTRHGAAWSKFGFLQSDPRTVAEKALSALERGKVMQGVGLAAYAAPIMGRLLPTAIWTQLMARTEMLIHRDQPIDSAHAAGLE